MITALLETLEGLGVTVGLTSEGKLYLDPVELVPDELWVLFLDSREAIKGHLLAQRDLEEARARARIDRATVRLADGEGWWDQVFELLGPLFGPRQRAGTQERNGQHLATEDVVPGDLAGWRARLEARILNRGRRLDEVWIFSLFTYYPTQPSTHCRIIRQLMPAPEGMWSPSAVRVSR